MVSSMPSLQPTMRCLAGHPSNPINLQSTSGQDPPLRLVFSWAPLAMPCSVGLRLVRERIVPPNTEPSHDHHTSEPWFIIHYILSGTTLVLSCTCANVVWGLWKYFPALTGLSQRTPIKPWNSPQLGYSWLFFWPQLQHHPSCSCLRIISLIQVGWTGEPTKTRQRDAKELPDFLQRLPAVFIMNQTDGNSDTAKSTGTANSV